MTREIKNNTRNYSGTRKDAIVYLIFVVLIALVIGIGYMLSDSISMTVAGWITIFTYIFSIIVVLRINDWKAFPFSLFLIYCFFSNVGQTFTHLLGADSYTRFDIYANYSEYTIRSMLLYQSFFVNFTLIGYLICRRRTTDLYYIEGYQEENRMGKLYVIDLLFVVLAIIMLVNDIQELAKRSIFSYGDYYYEAREGINTLIQYIFYVTGFTFLLRSSRKKGYFGYFIIILLSTTSVLIGSRSKIIVPLVGCIAIYIITRKNNHQIKLKYIIIGLLLLYILSGFTPLRDLSLSKITLKTISEAYGSSFLKSIVTILQEMGGSARTITETMEAVNSGTIGYQNTIFYYLLKGFIPVKILDFLHIKPGISSLSAWVTNRGGSSSGWGYSIIAESYVNFGMVFGVLYGLFFGYIYRWAESKIGIFLNTRKYYLASGLLYVVSYGVFQARAELSLLSIPIRYTFYIAIVYWISNRVRFRRKI